ncbi:MAG: RsmE family RNA methyltransferase [Phycisphaerae bacterium]
MQGARFFCRDIGESVAVLSVEESHYAVSVRRVRPGDEIQLFDGAGREATGIVECAARRLEATITGVSERPFDLSCQLTLAVAMPKASRQGYLIEKCVELGVAALWPIVSDRSVVKPRAGAAARWTRRAIEAARQSERAWVPAIASPVAFREVFRRVSDFDRACLADLGASATSLVDTLAHEPRACSVLVCVGPEGGWSDAERRCALAAGASAVTLGPTVLRTETAAVAACAAVAVSCASVDSGGVKRPTGPSR